MREILFVIIILITQKLFAECVQTSVEIYPGEREISPNSLFIINGYGEFQNVIDSLNWKYPIYLKSEGIKINLNVIKIIKGSYKITQAILCPEKILTSGKEYVLLIDSLSGEDKRVFCRLNKNEDGIEDFFWYVKTNEDNEIPSWEKQPVLSSLYSVWLTDGPARYAIFSLDINEISEVFIITELIDLKTNEQNIFFLRYEREENLKVGRGMCSGAFDYYPNRSYKIRFSLVDINGNYNNNRTDWIVFKSPVK